MMSDSEIRERIDNILEKYTSPKNVEDKHGNVYYDFTFTEAKKALMSLFTEETVKAEIRAKIDALSTLIMGAGEYHDDPYEYVIRISDAQRYRSGLMQFDLSQPVYYDKSNPKEHKEKK